MAVRRKRVKAAPVPDDQAVTAQVRTVLSHLTKVLGVASEKQTAQPQVSLTDPSDIAALEAETDKMLRRLRKFITKAYGERCPDFDKDCPCCRVWVRYDLLEEELG